MQCNRSAHTAWTALIPCDQPITKNTYRIVIGRLFLISTACVSALLKKLKTR